MVRFAGYDETENKNIYWKHARAARLFAAGFDTISIAMDMKITEALALKYVAIGNSYFFGLPSPYQTEAR
jgi:hypothetical protein